MKIGYRGTKYTNPQTQADGVTRSIPVTRWTPEAIRQIPVVASQVIQDFVQANFPDLLDCPVTSRLCWYTDSFDNHFVIDFVPGTKGLMVATGGSGHGFKFLPNLGAYVVDRIEGKENDFLQHWEWRNLKPGQQAYNSIMEGTASKRSLQHQAMTGVGNVTKPLSRL